ncbi:membrane fusion protein (multidrug efflux system) [Parvibaculum indicum]|uniref:efflux RND transporter periplasmic adaptor subunit n=1 Tax=Parvibaculum indicum TaxID=562969 RepID=UPI001422074C|nr:membrane fusion protein (multidrug efflux system) [Parvibaculum indicum]
MRHFPTAALILCAVGVAVASPALSQQMPGGGPPAVEVVSVQQHSVRNQQKFNGRIEATEKVDIRARVEGYLGPLQYEEGNRVKQGDLLFVIEKDRYQADLKEAEANLASAKAEARLATTSYERARKLVARKAVAQSQLDDATANLQKAKAAVQAQEAAVSLAQLNLDYTDIKAPIDGRIGKASFSKGAYISPSSGSLALLVAQDPIDVTWPVPSRLYTEMVKGGAKKENVTVKLLLPDGSAYGPEGTILYTEPSANESTNTITVRAAFPNPDLLLVDQQLVTVVIESRKGEPRITVPQASLQIDQQGAYVLVVDKDSKAEIRRIETGEQTGKDIVVVKGLAEGDRVITVGQQKVQPGMTVSAHEANEAEAQQ